MNTVNPIRLHQNESQPLCLGCLNCRELNPCGGMRNAGGVFDCLQFCRCEDERTCDYVCRRKQSDFIERHKEVKGFALDNIPRIAPAPSSVLPSFVPFIYHPYRRFNRLATPAVAVPLFALFSHKTGEIKFRSRQELADHYHFDPSAKLVISGVSKDRDLETYWEHRRAANIPEQLCLLRPDLVTAPNFSLFLGVPRWDNLHNIKRIVICWSELTAQQLPASLHLNARTDTDWERLTTFIAERVEVQSVAFEFATGAAGTRGAWHVEQLVRLASRVRRPLQLVVRGGMQYLSSLYPAFGQIVVIDTTPFMKTIQRQRAIPKPNNGLKWHRQILSQDEPIDALFQHNVDECNKQVHRAFHRVWHLAATQAA